MDTFDLRKVSPEEKFAEVGKFQQQLQEHYIAFGELLSDIKRTGVYKVKGYKTFKEFIETEYNMTASFATKLIDTYETYMETLDMDSESVKEIGFDRLNMIKPFVKDTDIAIAESWIEEAKKLSPAELRAKIKDEKEKLKKPKSMKEVFVNQHYERMCVFFNSSPKEIDYKTAVYLHEVDLESIKAVVKEKQRKLEISD